MGVLPGMKKMFKKYQEITEIMEYQGYLPQQGVESSQIYFLTVPNAKFAGRRTILKFRFDDLLFSRTVALCLQASESFWI